MESVRIPVALRERVAEMSEATGLTRSQIVREFIEEGLACPPKWMRDLAETRGARREGVPIGA